MRKCLDSVVKQTLKDIEIICVNDGSPDNSQAILEEYAARDERIRIIEKPNGGLADARNVGIAAATGLYVGFVDSDDWIEPETYEVATGFMTEDIDLVCWGAKIICGHDDIYKSKAEKYHLLRLTGKLKAELATNKRLPVTVWNKLYKNSIIKEHGISSPKGLLFEDNWFFWKYIIQVRYIYCIDKCYYNYVLHENSIMANVYKKKTPRIMDRILGVYDLHSYYKKHYTLEGYTDFFADYYFRMFRKDYKYCDAENRLPLLAKASELANEMELDGSKYSRQIHFLRDGKYRKLQIVKKCKPGFWARLWQKRV